MPSETNEEEFGHVEADIQNTSDSSKQSGRKLLTVEAVTQVGKENG
jgi:hypothetical protein